MNHREFYQKVTDLLNEWNTGSMNPDELIDALEAAQQSVQSDYEPPCPECGLPMAEQRPGKYECLNPKCGS